MHAHSHRCQACKLVSRRASHNNIWAFPSFAIGRIALLWLVYRATTTTTRGSIFVDLPPSKFDTTHLQLRPLWNQSSSHRLSWPRTNHSPRPSFWKQLFSFFHWLIFVHDMEPTIWETIFYFSSICGVQVNKKPKDGEIIWMIIWYAWRLGK